MKRYIFLIFSSILCNDTAIDLSRLIIDEYSPANHKSVETRQKPISFNYYELETILNYILPAIPHRMCWRFLNIMDSLYMQQKAQFSSKTTNFFSSSEQIELKMWPKKAFYDVHKNLVNKICDRILSSLNTGLIPYATAFIVLNRLSSDTKKIILSHIYTKDWPFLVNKKEHFFSDHYCVFVGFVGGLMKKHLNEGKNYSLKHLNVLDDFVVQFALPGTHPEKDTLNILEKDFIDVVIVALQRNQV